MHTHHVGSSLAHLCPDPMLVLHQCCWYAVLVWVFWCAQYTASYSHGDIFDGQRLTDNTGHWWTTNGGGEDNDLQQTTQKHTGLTDGFKILGSEDGCSASACT